MLLASTHLTVPARMSPHVLALAVALGTLVGAVVPGYEVAAAVMGGGGLCVAGAIRPALAVCGVGAVLLAGGYLVAAGRMQATAVPTVAQRGAVHTARMVVEATPARSTFGWRYIARTQAVGDVVPPGIRVLVRQRHGLPPTVGDIVEIEGRLAPGARPDAPDWWRRYLDRMGIAVSVQASAMAVVGRRGGWAGARDGLARSMRDVVDRRVGGDDGAVVSGITLGFDERLSESRKEAFRRAGTSHLLAVSGQNVALVGLAAMGLLVLVGAARAWAVAGAAVAVLAYALLCQPGASVVRATLVGLLALGTMGAGRPARSAYPLILTFAAMIAWTPRAITDPGLILSFSAVVGILTMAPWLRRRLATWVPDAVAIALAVTAAATIGTAPASALLFGQVSLVGLVSNLVAVPVAGLVLVTGLIGALLGIVVPAAGTPLMLIAAGGAHVIVRVADACAQVPGAAVSGTRAAVLALAVGGPWALWRVGSRHAPR